MKLFPKRVKCALIAGLCWTNNSPFARANYTTRTDNVTALRNVSNSYLPTDPMIITSPQLNSATDDSRSGHDDSYDTERNSTEFTLDYPVSTQNLDNTSLTPPSSKTSTWTTDITPSSKSREDEDDPISLLPTSIPTKSDDWESIRKEQRTFVDKTKFLLQFRDTERKLNLFTRPRRFGKTFFVSILKSYLTGKNDTFKGTYIFDYGNCKNKSWITYPVIHLDFGEIAFKEFEDDQYRDMVAYYEEQFEKLITDCLNLHEMVPLFKNDIGSLIKAFHVRNNRLPVAILIDEYDSVINEAVLHKQCIKHVDHLSFFLKEKFKAIKSNTPFIKLAWVTGVRKMDWQGIFSGANSFTDLTYEPTFATLAGFTKKEIQETFKVHINLLANQLHRDADNITSELQTWYDGYIFNTRTLDVVKNEEMKVYNPISVMTCFVEQRFDHHWCDTGSCNIVLEHIYEAWFKNKEMESKKIMWDEDLEVSRRDILSQKYHPSRFPGWLLMLNSGYLTFKEYYLQNDNYTLKIPNTEVRTFLEHRMEQYVPIMGIELENYPEYVEEQLRLRKMMEDLDYIGAVDALNNLMFPDFKFPLNQVNPEKGELDVTRRIIISLRGAKAGADYTKLKVGNKDVGDFDAFTTNLTTNYVFEVKYGGPPDAAIIQLLGYLRNYNDTFLQTLHNPNRIILMGLTFDRSGKREKNAKIGSWVAIPYENDTLQLDFMECSLDEVCIAAEEYWKNIPTTKKWKREKKNKYRTKYPPNDSLEESTQNFIV